MSNGTVPNTTEPNWVITTCKAKVSRNTPSISLFLNRDLKMLSFVRLLLLKALKSWNTTNNVKRMVYISPGAPPKKFEKL